MTRHWLHSSPRKKEECAISFFAPCFLRALLLPRFDIVRTNEVYWCYSKWCVSTRQKCFEFKGLLSDSQAISAQSPF